MRLDKWISDRAAARRAKYALVASVVITLGLYLVPGGRFVAYPLMLFSTLVHELGHGLTAIVCGGGFESLEMYADGSGVARHGGEVSAVGAALVAAGGLLGPAIGAAVAFALGRHAKAARVAMGMFAAFLALMVALFIDNTFGRVFTGLVALGFGYLAVRHKPEVAQLAIVFVGVQLALSVFSRGDYLFTDAAHTGAGVLPSDTAQMATALGGSSWMWGLVCGGFSILVLGAGVWWFWRVFSTQKSVLSA